MCRSQRICQVTSLTRRAFDEQRAWLTDGKAVRFSGIVFWSRVVRDAESNDVAIEARMWRRQPDLKLLCSYWSLDLLIDKHGVARSLDSQTSGRCGVALDLDPHS